MAIHFRRGVPAACLVLAAFLGPARAQEQPPLSGPSVPEVVVRTLVQHDARGQFIRVEGRPEAVALSVIRMDPHQRDAVRQTTSDREGAINLLLVDQLDLVERGVDAFRAGDTAKTQALLRELRDGFDGASTRDPLLKPLSDALAPEQHAEVARLLDEYWKAWVDWELLGETDRSAAAGARTQDRLVLTLFEEEVRGAYDRTLRRYRERLERIEFIAEPTAEQRSQVRAAMTDFIRQTRLQPSMAERRRAAQRIYAALDETRRLRLLDAFLFDY